MYPDGKEYVLEHFNLHIPAGMNVAIVGEDVYKRQAFTFFFPANTVPAI